MSNTEGFVFNFDEAVTPKGSDPIPGGLYNFVITDAPVNVRGDFQVVTIWLQVEGGEYDGRMVFDDWFMPNRQKQDPEKFKEALGFLQQRLEAVYGIQVTGDFKLNPADLVGRRVQAEVGIRRDKVKGEGAVINGEQQYYDPKNRVRRYIPNQNGGMSPTVAAAAAYVPPTAMQPQQPAPQPAQAAPAQAVPQAPAAQPAPAPQPQQGEPAPSAAFRL